MSLIERYGIVGILLLGAIVFGLERNIVSWWKYGHSVPSWVEHAVHVALPVVIAVSVGTVVLLAWLVSNRIHYRHARLHSLRTVEIVLSRDEAADPHEVMGFLDAAYHLCRARYFWLRWIRGQDHFCFEIAKGADEVIRLYLAAPSPKLEGLMARLRSTYTNITYTEVEPDQRNWPVGYQLRLEKNPYLFTLKTLKDYQLSVIEGLAAAWAGMEGQARVQYIFVPRPLSDTHRLRERQQQYEAEHQARRNADPDDPGLGYVQDKELKGSMEQLGKGLFRVELRIAADRKELARAAIAAFGEASGTNRLLESRMLLRKRLWQRWFVLRLPSLLFLPGCMLSAAHLATLFHLPSVRLRGVNFNRSMVRRSSAGQAVPRDERFAIMHDERGSISIPESDRKYGVLLLGTQGTGKSTTMLNLIRADACK